jgi:hypothetical protein
VSRPTFPRSGEFESYRLAIPLTSKVQVKLNPRTQGLMGLTENNWLSSIQRVMLNVGGNGTPVGLCRINLPKDIELEFSKVVIRQLLTPRFLPSAPSSLVRVLSTFSFVHSSLDRNPHLLYTHRMWMKLDLRRMENYQWVDSGLGRLVILWSSFPVTLVPYTTLTDAHEKLSLLKKR